jgi:hypothetical protein
MNKLYILGALALANVDAKVLFHTTAGTALTPLSGTPATNLAPAGLGGTYTYAYTGDCISSGALTTLGLNNNYYQYYYIALTKGTATYTAIGQTVPTHTDAAIATNSVAAILSTITNVYSGCWHMHIYNWIAMPTLSSTSAVTSVTAGFGNAVVGYGYAMVGTATTACAVATIVTTTLFTSSKFYGAQYQGSILTITSSKDAATTTSITTTVPVWGVQGPGYYATKTTTALIASSSPAQLGMAFATS